MPIRPLETPPRHRNITFERLLLDALQFVRVQSFVPEGLGARFRPGREYAEIDVTYKCNLKCANCNRSCTQAPSDAEMPVSTIESFVRQSVERKIAWKRIRILGGEPTLHSRFFDIVDLLIDYRKRHNPSARLVLCTNFFGDRVRRTIERLPREIAVKSTLKTSRENLFRPFNVAPADTVYNRFSDYSRGCRIIEDCGLGLTPSGYYMCAVAGGIDRIFGYGLGRSEMPDESDDFSDQRLAFCPLCGHFGFQWPTRKSRMSKTWISAYERLKSGRTESK
jgi:uncharacterized Fe-S cluster-containing radical SAM superfamily protein